MSCNRDNCQNGKKIFRKWNRQRSSYIAYLYRFEIRHPKFFVLVQQPAFLILGQLGSKAHLTPWTRLRWWNEGKSWLYTSSTGVYRKNTPRFLLDNSDISNNHFLFLIIVVDINLWLASITVTGTWPDWKTPSSIMSHVWSARVRGLQ